MKNILLTIVMIACLGSLQAQTGFSIASGTVVKLNNGTNLVLDQMDFENKGTFSDGASSTIKFTGANDNGIYASLTLEFYNLEISKSAGATVLLQKNIVVENNLNIAQGKLNLNTFKLTLDDGQIIGENATNYITGTNGGFIEITTDLNSPDQANPGNLGIEITSVANLGQTVIQRGHEEQTSNEGGKSILRYYDITPVNNTGLNATFRMYYNDAELNGIPENELESWRSTDSGNNWELQEGSIVNTMNNWVQLSGVDAFSRWTLASATTAPLPVDLFYFKGKAANDLNLLEWSTLSEENVSHFEIQKLEANQWKTMGRVEAAHFSSDLQEYAFEDYDYQTLDYYQLQIIDFDEAVDFSEVILIERNATEKDILKVYPNPTQDYVYLSSNSNLQIDEIRLFDALGNQILSYENFNDQLDITNLASGVYYLEVHSNQQTFIKKITKL